MVNLEKVKDNIELYYKNCFMAYVGCYSLASKVEDLGDFYDIFSRHSNILKCFREEIDEFLIDVDLGINNPMEFEDELEYLCVLNDHVCNMRSINKVMKKSYCDLVLTSRCINLYEESIELGESATFMIKEGDKINNYSMDELWVKVNSSSKKNYNDFFEVQYVKKLKKGERNE